MGPYKCHGFTALGPLGQKDKQTLGTSKGATQGHMASKRQSQGNSWDPPDARTVLTSPITCLSLASKLLFATSRSEPYGL